MHWQGRSIEVSLDCVLIWNVVVFAKCSSEVHNSARPSCNRLWRCSLAAILSKQYFFTVQSLMETSSLFRVKLYFPMITCFSFHLVRLPQNLLLRCSNPREIQWTLVRFSEPSSDSVNPRQIQWTILVLISELLKFLKVHITTGCPDWRISRGPTYF